MNINKLNLVAKFLEDNGVVVTKESVISICIKTLVDSGYSVKQAYDEVLGVGSYDKSVELIYTDLKNSMA